MQRASVLLERGPEVERERVSALRPLALALALGGGGVDAAVGREHDAVAGLRALARDEPERDVARDELGRPVEAVLQPPPPAVR